MHVNACTELTDQYLFSLFNAVFFAKVYPDKSVFFSLCKIYLIKKQGQKKT